MNAPVFRALRLHLESARSTARFLHDESSVDAHRAAFDGVLFHVGQAARICDDVADIDTVEGAQRDLDALQEYAATRDTEPPESDEK